VLYKYQVKSEGFMVIDGTSGIGQQQQLVRQTVTKLLESYNETDHYAETKKLYHNRYSG
jgi:hypothetical protein